MRIILLLTCLLWATVASAQSALKTLPTDSASGKIAYQAVVMVPGASKAELYSRAREWVATEFRSAKDVVQMDDKEAGKLVARGFVPKRIGSVSARPSAGNQFWRTIKIYVKDGRYRYEITDFAIESPYESGPLEKRLEVAANAPFSGGKTGSPKGHYKYLLESVAETTEPEVASLQKAMAGAKEKDF
jgi:hypothetical protein